MTALPIMAALAGAALAAVVLWPLRRYSRSGFIAGCLSLAIASGCLYLLVGQPDTAQQRSDPAADLQQGVQALQRSLQRDPAQPEGWMLLGRALAELGQPAQASAAFDRAVALSPDEPLLLVEAAQARAQAAPDRRFDDTALAWLQQARQREPSAERASWLLGIALRQRGRNAEAVQVWSELLPRLQPDAAQALQAQIERAREAEQDHAPAGAALLQVRVRLPSGLQVPEQARLFVLARAPGGSPMPVAVRRLTVADAGHSITLSDADSPMPTAPLSSHASVEVLARLSRNGSATRGEDDLQSEVVRVHVPDPQVIELQLR